MKKIYILSLLLIFFSSCNSPSKIAWMEWSEAENRTLKQDKNGFVWIYTDWCEESQAMMNGVLKNPDLIEFVNENFYAIKFHGQSKEEIKVKGLTWKFVEGDQGDYHELAHALTVTDKQNLNQSISYPKIAFLDTELNLIIPIDARMDLKEMEILLAFVASNSFKEKTVEAFMLEYQTSFEE